MYTRKVRPVIFVCVGMNNKGDDFISRIIKANSQSEASSLFFEQNGIEAKSIHGPFRPKRVQIIENNRTLLFADKPQQKAIYNDWEVMALYLKEPANSAYLLFNKRVDGKKMSPPKGTVIVSISDLRII